MPLQHRGPVKNVADDEHCYTREYAIARDCADPLSRFRREFWIPSKAHLQTQTLQQGFASSVSASPSTPAEPSIYLCGNSLGLQPQRTATRINQYLSTWSTQGVFGHFKPLDNSPLPTWLDADDDAARRMAPIVGAEVSEVAVMQTLTANLHFLMTWLYRPERGGKHKIILESKAFPSDHYAVESQIELHGFDVSTSMITIEPLSPDSPLLTTDHILNVIQKHSKDTALIILPGIQFYTGQLLDIKTITAAANALDIRIIWDLAHAVGNVPLDLHNHNVDAAAWCSYKYLNAGPGSIAGLFVHSKHDNLQRPAMRVSNDSHNPPAAKHGGRLSGWWGSSKASRFQMNNHFEASLGASAFQLSNPSIYDITSLCASLELFSEAGGMQVLREKSMQLTAYLEMLLRARQRTTESSPDTANSDSNTANTPLFEIITPSDPAQRGAQISLKLREGLLDAVMASLVAAGVVVDERRPDVIRVAPAPLYNSWEDVWAFDVAFAAALGEAVGALRGGQEGGKARGTDGVVDVAVEGLLQTT